MNEKHSTFSVVTGISQFYISIIVLQLVKLPLTYSYCTIVQPAAYQLNRCTLYTRRSKITETNHVLVNLTQPY
jgi:hypothetical protein